MQPRRAQPLSPDEVQAIAYKCEQAVLRFSAAFDSKDIDEMERHFSATGVWRRRDGDITGLVQLRRLMETRPSSLLVRHILSNLRTSVIDDMTATVDSYVTVYRHDFNVEGDKPAPLLGVDLVGSYRDRLELQTGQWKLVHREVHVDFKQ